MTDINVTSIGLHPRYKRHNSEALKHLMAALAAQGMAMEALKASGLHQAQVWIDRRDSAMRLYIAKQGDPRTTSVACPWNHAAGDEFLGGQS